MDISSTKAFRSNSRAMMAKAREKKRNYMLFLAHKLQLLWIMQSIIRSWFNLWEKYKIIYT